jgi:hypothetical protein
VFLFADITIVEAGMIIGPLAGAVVVIFRLLVVSHAAQIAAEKSRAESYREMLIEANKALEDEVNTQRRNRGQEPLPVVAAVVPEHSSPVTKEQQETADLQTERARLTALTLALGLPPRTTGPPETDEQRQVRERGEKTEPEES